MKITYCEGRATTVTGPTVEPVSRALAKTHIRAADEDSEDTLIDIYIAAAREYVEGATGRALVAQTLQDQFDSFTDMMVLSRSPVQSVISIVYDDTAGDEQTLDSDLYEVDLKSLPARIKRAYNATFPDLKDGGLNRVRVNYVAGYPDDSGSPTDLASGVPNALKHAILLIVGDSYENREHQQTPPLNVNRAVERILSHWRIETLR